MTVAALVSLYRTDQLGSHLQRALDNGLSKDELVQAITHLAFYAGWPNAMTAIAHLKQITEGYEHGRHSRPGRGERADVRTGPAAGLWSPAGRAQRGCRRGANGPFGIILLIFPNGRWVPLDLGITAVWSMPMPLCLRFPCPPGR